MSHPEPTIRVAVDLTNPGQFFACCGLLELADRLWDEARGWFVGGEFLIDCGGGLPELIGKSGRAELKQLDPTDNTASPIMVGSPFRPLRLDWWRDERAGGKELKSWGGRMDSYRIARSMQLAMIDPRFIAADLFDVGVVAYDPGNLKNKVEPFYFDARRAPNAHPRDVGFSLDAIEMETTTHPAVEFFCLVGLQRCRPSRTDRPRAYEFDYHTWRRPLPPSLLPAAVSGLLASGDQPGYRFENWRRTGRKELKAFRPAALLPPKG